MDEASAKTYYLQVVPDGEEPDWPCPPEELVVGHQPLEGNLIQYWAYFKESGKDPSDLPRAEVVASEYKTNNPAVLIDEYPTDGGESLELILVKGGHALAKTQSSADNLEDNISSILETAKKQFNLDVEHFMTTDRVPQEVESKLNDLEETEGLEESDNQSSAFSHQPPDESLPVAGKPVNRELENQYPKTENRKPITNNPERSDFEMAGRGGEEEGTNIRKVNSQIPTGGIFTAQKRDSGNASSSKLWIVLPVILLLLAVVGVFSYMNKDQLLSKINLGGKAEVAATPTPTPSSRPTPTPTPSIERAKYQVRVLNGTRTAGAAAKLKEKLESLGWKVLSVGNNTNQNIDQTQVRAKDSAATASGVLILDLSSDYEASAGAALKSTDKADLEVIIGGK